MKLFVGISAICLVLLGALYIRDWALLRIYWRVVASEKAPDGRMTAYHLKSGNDGYGEAPYGDHVALTDAIWPMTKYSAPHVFAGYCGPLKLRWAGPKALMIQCITEKKARVAKQTDSFGDIKIEYEFSTRDVP